MISMSGGSVGGGGAGGGGEGTGGVKLSDVDSTEDGENIAGIVDENVEGIRVHYRCYLRMPPVYKSKLESAELSQLFYLFLTHYINVVQIANDTDKFISLRGEGDLLDRRLWGSLFDCEALWKISVEDPFERYDSVHPHVRALSDIFFDIWIFGFLFIPLPN